MFLRSLLRNPFRRMASFTAHTVPGDGVSRRLRELADLLDRGDAQQTAHVAQCLQSLAQQLVASPQAPQAAPQAAAAAAAAVEALERSYVAPAADKPAAQDTEQQNVQPRSKKQRREQKVFDFSKYGTRYVALHLMYVGWSYHGLARQADTDNTIEGHLFPALRRVKLIPDDADISTLAYSRCGRTDKGVSALGQVLALRLRSCGLAGQALPPADSELDYPSLVNKVLPDTIRVLGWADVPPDFSARFNARDREYKYFIVQDGGLDLAAMQAAAQHLVGEHDYRNFCKADVAQVRNFRRHVLSACIEPAATSCPGMTVVALHLKGTAFLWHQVRCIAAVLLMVGRGQEQPSVIQQLLDLSQAPCKPQYSYAAEEPLLLYSCNFEGVSWRRSEGMLDRCLAVVGSQLQQHLVATALTSSIYESLQAERAALLAPAGVGVQQQQNVCEQRQQQEQQDVGEQLQQQQRQQQEQQDQQQEPLTSVEVCHAAAQDGMPVQQQHQQQQLGAAGVTSNGAAAALQQASVAGVLGVKRWLIPKPSHMKLMKRATEPSIEERFGKAGIPLELLNQKGGGMQE